MGHEERSAIMREQHKLWTITATTATAATPSVAQQNWTRIRVAMQNVQQTAVTNNTSDIITGRLCTVQ